MATVDIAGYPTFGAGSFSVRARHEGTDGFYALFMPMTTEQSVIGGRETFGEPKKIGAVELAPRRRPGHRAPSPAWASRSSGWRARVTGELEPGGPETRTDFYFKFLPAPDGKGFDTDPALVYCHRTEQTRTARAVSRARCMLRESRFDPVADLPVREIVGITLSERSSVQRGEIHGTVPGEWIRPYVHQRYDDLSPAGRRSHEGARRPGGGGHRWRRRHRARPWASGSPARACGWCWPTSTPGRSSEVTDDLAARGLDVAGMPCDVADDASVEGLRDRVLEELRGGPPAVQQRRHRRRRRGRAVGARAQRLAVGVRRQRLRRHPRHQRLRAGHGGVGIGGPRGEHLLGQRGRLAAAAARRSTR